MSGGSSTGWHNNNQPVMLGLGFDESPYPQRALLRDVISSSAYLIPWLTSPPPQSSSRHCSLLAGVHKEGRVKLAFSAPLIREGPWGSVNEGTVKANEHQMGQAVKKLYDIDMAKVITLIRPDGEEKAPDCDAVDVANKIGII
ncbi:hypothetical protein CB1_000929013 [Camelus ferus]|nr:hypothetical protein CB1_000929013 [Camelus ferus]